MAKYLNEAGTKQLISKIKTNLALKVNLSGATMTGGLVAPSLTASSSTTTSLVNLNNGNIIIKAPTTSSTNLTFANRTSNPSITFADSTETTSAALIYRDNSLNLLGKTANAYFTAPNIKATGSFYGNLSGNASTATTASTASKVANKLTFKNVKSANLEYDGSTAVTIDKTAIINILGYAPTDVESALEYKGILNDKNELPNSTDTKNGDVYVIGTGGTLKVNSSDNNTTINSNSDPDVEAGDMIVAYKTVNDVSWTVIQKNIDGAVRSTTSSTDNAIARFDGTTGKIIQNSTATIDDHGSLKLKGHITLDPAYDSTNNLYNQGLRINQASDNWAGVFLGGAKDSNNGESVWVIGRRGTKGTVSGKVGDLTLEYGDATGNGLTLPAEDGDPTWKGNKIWHAGNDGKDSGLDADLLDGQHASYYTNAGNLSSGTILNARLPERLKDYSDQLNASADNAVEQGWHYIADGDTVRPPFKNSDSSANTDYRVMNNAHNSLWLQQLATNYHSNDMFIRRNQNGAWSGWTSIVKAEEGLANPTGTENAVPKWDGTKNSTLKDTGVIIDNSNNIKIPGLITQGSPSDDTTITKMNRFASDLFVSGDGGLSTNNPKVAGIYLAKNSNNDIPHIDIVTGNQATYSYIDFNKAGVDRDFDFRILVNHTDGNVEMKWAREFSNKSLKLTDSFEAATIKKTNDTDDNILLAGGGTKAISDFASKTDLPNMSNYVTISTAQTINGAKTFTGIQKFTGESRFSNSDYCPDNSIADIADGIGKSSLFARSATMQTIAGQIIAPNRSNSTELKDTYGYDTEAGKIKLQYISSQSASKVTGGDIAVFSKDNINFYSTNAPTWNGNKILVGANIEASKVLVTDANSNVVTVVQGNAFNKNFGTAAGTVARGDHNHNSLYYTQAQINTTVIGITTSINNINEELAKKAAAEHKHTIVDITDINQASVKYAESAGTATTASTATQVANALSFKKNDGTNISYNGSTAVTIDKNTIVSMLGYTPTDVNSALVFKGSRTELQLPSVDKTTNGDVYVMDTSGPLEDNNKSQVNTNSNRNVEVGDMIIAYKPNSETVLWTVIQKNIDGALIGPATNTSRAIPVFSAANSNTLINTGVTISHEDILSAPRISSPIIETGDRDDSYVQTKKIRGGGNGPMYSHAIDLGYHNHNRVDFYEWGGIYNFWKNESEAITTDENNLCLQIGLSSVKNKTNTFTWPATSGTLALTTDITNSLNNYVTISGPQIITDLKTFSSGDFGNALAVRRTGSHQGAVIKFENQDTSSSEIRTLGYIGMTVGANSSLYRWTVDGKDSYKVWDSGNDGDGSGLHADLLDNKHASDFVDKEVGLKLKGTLTSTNTTLTLPAAGSVVNGDLYLIGTAGTLTTNGTSSVNSNYSSVVEAGDMILASKDNDSETVSWSVIQKNLERPVSGPSESTSNAVPRFDGTTGKIIKNTGVTISDSNVLTAAQLAANIIETGTGDNNYFQSRKFRGEGNAATYYHAIDFGFKNHNQVDFYEHGGIWNFWKNTTSTATIANTNLCLQIGNSYVRNKENTFTWPTKSGTIALAADVVTKENILADNTDLNTIQTSGFYRLQDTGMVNGPEGTTSGQMIVCHGGKDTLAQIAFPYNETKMYIRTGTTSTFRDWKRVVTDDELTKNKIINLLGYTPSDINDAIEYKGTLTTLTLPAGNITKHGDAYIMGVSGALVNNTTNGSSTVDTAFSSLKTVEIGDMIIANKTDKSSNNVTWSIIQRNVDNNVVGLSNEHTVNTIPVWNAATGGVLKDTKATVTASTSNNVTKTTITADYFSGLASNATVATSANSVKVTNIISTGNTADTYKLLIAGNSTITANTSTAVHAFNEVSIDPDGYSVTVNNVTTKYPKLSLGTVRVDGDDVVNKRNIGSMSVSYATTAGTATTATTATKAVQDGNGNTITTKYATLDTQQNFKEIKSFGSGAIFGNNTSNTTYSSTGCKIVYNATDECLDFIFN